MKKILTGRSLLVAILLLTSVTLSFSQQFKVLLFTKTDGFHHESIHEGVTAIRQLAARNISTVPRLPDGKFVPP